MSIVPSMIARWRNHPFVVGIMIGLVLNLGLVPLIDAANVSAQPPQGGPILPAPQQGVVPAAQENVMQQDDGSILLRQQKIIYSMLFDDAWDGSGSIYNIDEVPQGPGLTVAINVKNDQAVVFETVALQPLHMSDVDNSSLGLHEEDVALLDAMDPQGNVIVGRLISNVASVDVVAIAMEWNVLDQQVDYPTLVILGLFDDLLSADGTLLPEDYIDGAGRPWVDAAAAASTVSCADGRAVQTDGLYDACVAAARLALAACLIAALAALGVCLAKVAKLLAKAIRVCRWILVPPLMKACMAAAAVAAAAGAAFCLGVAAAAAFACAIGYEEAVDWCGRNLCARTAPKIDVPATSAPGAVARD